MYLNLVDWVLMADTDALQHNQCVYKSKTWPIENM